MRFLFLLTSLCVGAMGLILLVPEPALAWGPGVHIVLSDWLLRHSSLLPPEVAAPLMQFPGQFIQGALSPDIFIGKGSVATEGHSHNWATGLALLERSKAPRWQAYAYGYLSHLGGDVVAHNLYVPETFQRTFGAGRLAHVYMEAQADRLVAWKSSAALKAFHEDGSRRSAQILRASIAKKKNFWLKKGLFEGSIAVTANPVWRATLRLLDSLFPAEDLPPFLNMTLNYSLRSILSILRDPYAAPVLNLDPVGTMALARAHQEDQETPRVHFISRLASLRALSRKRPASRHPLQHIIIPDILLNLPDEGLPELIIEENGRPPEQA